jgi:tetratricopeptide (TPR) repeat protein
MAIHPVEENVALQLIYKIQYEEILIETEEVRRGLDAQTTLKIGKSTMRHRINMSVLLLLCWVLVGPAHAQISEQQATLTSEQYTEAGNRFAKEKQYDKAVDAFKLAIKLNPNLAAAYLGLGNAYAHMERVGDALEPMRIAVRLDPNNSLAHLSLGRALAYLKHPDEAITELNEAKRLDPNNANTHNEIGNVFLDRFGSGRLDDALAAYLEARRLNPDLYYVHHNIGLVFMRLERFSEAVNPFQEALRLNPQFRYARFGLADAYTKIGSYDKAIDSWTRFLELVPNGPDALTKRSWTYLYQGGHGREAAADAHNFLKMHGWQRATSPYLAIMAYLGYREAGLTEEAQAILEEAKDESKTAGWPYSIIRHLHGELSIDDLLQLAIDNDKKTEAHAYIGMDLLMKAKNDEARKHFQWVKDYGNKRFFEYSLSIEELRRLR